MIIGIGVFDKDSAPRRHFRHKCAIGQDSHQYRQVVLLGHLHILLAKCWRHMDEARAIFGRDKIAQHHIVSGLVRRHEGIQRMVFHTVELPALERFQDFHFLAAKNLFHQRFGQEQLFLLRRDCHARRSHNQRRGAQQQPRCRAASREWWSTPAGKHRADPPAACGQRPRGRSASS